MATLSAPGGVVVQSRATGSTCERFPSATIRTAPGQRKPGVKLGRVSCKSTPLRRRIEVRASVGNGAPSGAPTPGPLKVIISGAPASGKGTQCELIKEKFQLVHISAGDLLRAEVAEGTPNGREAQSFMDAGQLVPDHVVNNIVKDHLTRPDAQRRGWLLDGYPRSKSQAESLVAAGIVPDVFILLQVPDEAIVQRVSGRRMDPETGKIYNLTFEPPPNDPALLARLVQRSDDTEEKIVARLETHARNVNSVVDLYQDRLHEVKGTGNKEAIFGEISAILTAALGAKARAQQLAPAAEAAKA